MKKKTLSVRAPHAYILKKHGFKVSQIMKILNKSKKWVMKGLFVVKLENLSREREVVGHPSYHLNDKGAEKVKVQYRRICKENKQER